MPLALSRHSAVNVFADRLEDGQIHYGLTFSLPGFAHNKVTAGDTGTDSSNEAAFVAQIAEIRKCSDLDTQSRHGAIDNWWVGVPIAPLPPGQVALLIPRTWLIRQGFLPWWVALLPYRAFAMRNAEALKQAYLAGMLCKRRRMRRPADAESGLTRAYWRSSLTSLLAAKAPACCYIAR